ncbi:DUF3857 domain-containing protein [Prolixibacter denitrificans]|uniref:Transglutaminase-like putative cysteine protease n=1 Tax=Prolixibacter denitrificans TaxID=1541063 RepID=A0A2P8C7J9_9BACT|nr:DUF3857 domain-containing protein [Prolixibacter denitrificans]PSK80953.1 transglutaminase-like putative cysteine protease [Prolixibacter denitrificans]GET22353.1 hypothetical protein JCM18694_25990 [Prolixibacter denitrificans]
MKTLFLTFLCTFFFSIPVFSQSSRDAASIPDSLKKHADAVIREYQVTYNRTGAGSYSRKVHLVATILNSNGRGEANLVVMYDHNSNVSQIGGTVYDAHGKTVKRLRNKDIRDFAYNESYTLFGDNRVKFFRPAYKLYPYTVEYYYKVNYNDLVGFGNWVPASGYNTSVEKAELTFITPNKFQLRHKDLNSDFAFSQTTEKNTVTYHWQLSGFKALEWERLAPDFMDVFPVVLLSPDDMSYEGTTGNFATWKGYGAWTYQLIRDRTLLPEETILKLFRLTDSIPDKRDKVKAVYRYMQKKTRYVNIALGIGGFQPLMAEDVDAKGYGDCKALSNYTRSLLKAIGIDSYYTVIGSGDYRQIKYPDFPGASQMNHAILFVPLDQDTIWLECTNQQIPFGYISLDNANRFALQISAEGGKLVRTPKYTEKENRRDSHIQVNLQNNGAASFQLNSEFEEGEFEDVFGVLHLSSKEQKDALTRWLNVPGLTIQNFSMQDISADTAKAKLNVKGETSRYAIPTGNRMFVSTNFLIENSFPSHLSTDRQLEIYQRTGYTYKDTLTITIPDGFKVEYLPKKTELSSSFGDYEINYGQNGNNTIEVTRKVVIHQGKYKADDVKSINDFLTGIASQERQKVVLVKKV